MQPKMTKNERDALVTSNLALVGYAVREVMARVPAHVQRDDLASAGSLALVQASRAYDPSQGVPFARYAAVRIRGALLDELRGMDWVSRGARARARNLQQTRDRLTSELGRAPSRDELANVLGVTPAEVDAAREDGERRLLSLDGFEDPILDQVADGGVGPEDALVMGERVRYLHAAVAELPERLRLVISALYFEDRSIAEIADELDVTQSRISQLRTEALTLMRDGMNASLDPALVEPVARPEGVAARRREAYYAAIAATAAQNSATRAVATLHPAAPEPVALSIAT